MANDLTGNNLITDLPGIAVGNAHDETALTGVTVIVIDSPNTAGVVIKGGAPGTRGTSILAPENTGDGVDAVVLSGGSAFGLDAAGGVMAVLRERGIGFAVGPVRVPIVLQAITFDLLNGGSGLRLDSPDYWHLGRKAALATGPDVFQLGSAGGGLGATTVNCKGGLGSASALTASGYRVGAVAVVNAVGSTLVGNGPHFWAAPYEVGSEFGGLGFPQYLTSDDLALAMKGGRGPAPPSTTIALVATDAKLTKAQTRRLALMADDGFSRAVRPAHAPMDGDTVFAVATQAREVTDPIAALTEIGSAAADCLARAIARGIYEATTPSGSYNGPPAYRDRFAGQQASPGGDAVA